MSKVTFHGSPAWVGAIQSPTICDWWNSDPDQLQWDRSLLRAVDLSRTPSAALAGTLAVSQIEVDDHVSSGGRTTIGPLWPSGTTIGALWVSGSFLSRIGAPLPGVPAGGSGHDYEYRTIHYFDGEQQNRRFHGFQARLLQVQNTLSLVEIWNPGTGAGAASPAGAWWLDLAATADPGTPPLVVNQPAALFLDATTVTSLALLEPKLPPYLGGFGFPG